MSSSSRDGDGAEFERALIESARADELPDVRTEEAWARLAAAVAALPDVSGPGSVERARGAEAVAAWGAHGVATRWLLLGALGGGVVTASLMGWGQLHRDGRSASEAVLAAPSVVAPAETPRRDAAERSGATSGASLGATTSRGVRPGTPTPRAGSARRSAVANDEPRRALGRSAERGTERGTLAAEVAALDAARKAGSADETLRLIDRYQYDFPEGELAADAEVVALEALAAKDDRDEVARRAVRFLARYPNDPHAAEVRLLGGR
jgi:hypothetical protein